MSLPGIVLQLALTDVLAIITAVGVFLTGLGTWMNRSTLKKTNKAVQTETECTLGELVKETNDIVKAQKEV